MFIIKMRGIKDIQEDISDAPFQIKISRMSGIKI